MHLSRRALLRTWAGGSIVATLVAACGPQSPAQPTAAPPVAPAQAPATPATQAQAAQQGATPRNGGSFRFSIWTEDPPSLDPYLNVSFRSQEFAAFFYSRLLMSKKGPGISAQAYIMEGDLAESWNVSQDGKTWTFNLRPNAVWQNVAPMNGRAVTAQDVAWSFDHFMQVSAQKSTFDIVANVSAPDAHTVVFTLKDAYVPFEAAIGAPLFWILPREVIEQDGDASKRVVGSGPFIFEKYDSGVSFTAKKNPNYYRAGEPHVDEVVGLVIPDDATAMAGLRAHELDFYQVANQNADSLKSTNPEIQQIEWEFLLIPFFYWKVDQPPFNDVRVRRAVSLATNRDNLITTIYSGKGNWNNFIPWALTEWWLDPRGPDQGPTASYFAYDPAQAKQLLADAGYPNGLQVDLISTPGYGQVWVQSVELVQQDLKAAGINGNIQMQEYTAYIGSTFKGQFEPGKLVLGLETPFTEPHDFLFNMYHPNGTRNHAGINDPKLTAMIEQQARTLDRAQRKQQIFDIQRYLAEQMYYPPVAANMRVGGVGPTVRDFYPRSDYGFGAEVVPKLWLDASA
ncbi:MAG: ABC transporter substrate-binding protein [Chloroflexi bacterium]|nr:ABC transporter substrate-binding protein [Chloroflexota bacterium]